MPPVTCLVLVSGAMAGTTRKSARFIRKWIMFLVFERPHRLVGSVHPITITTELRTWRSILQVIFTIMFVHPRAFDERSQKSVVSMFTKSFPAMNTIIELNERNPLPFWLQGAPVNFITI